jgi:hypothetical protein
MTQIQILLSLKIKPKIINKIINLNNKAISLLAQIIHKIKVTLEIKLKIIQI